MKLFNSSINLRDVASLVATSTLMLAASPALAVTFSFCGQFTNGDIPDGKINGHISVDNQGTFANSANITTTPTPAQVLSGKPVINYTQANFGGRTTANHPAQGIESYLYTFNNTVANSVFQVYLPKSIFPITVPIPDLDLSAFQPFQQYETRNGILASDPDKLEVPEPLTILGTGVVLGAIPALKKEYAKSKKKKDGAA